MCSQSVAIACGHTVERGLHASHLIHHEVNRQTLTIFHYTHHQACQYQQHQLLIMLVALVEHINWTSAYAHNIHMFSNGQKSTQVRIGLLLFFKSWPMLKCHGDAIVASPLIRINGHAMQTLAIVMKSQCQRFYMRNYLNNRWLSNRSKREAL